MLTALSHVAATRSKRALAVGGVLLLIAGVLGGPAQTALHGRNDFEDPGSQAAAARTQLQRATGAEPAPGVLALVRAAPGSALAGSTLRTLESDRDVAHAGPLIPSRERSQTLIPATFKAGVDDGTAADHAISLLGRTKGVVLGGAAIAQREVGKQVSADLAFAEAIVFPLLAILAIVFFRGFAAALPLASGLTSILTTFALLRLINIALRLSIFALNLVIGLGLGLAVDYSLFMVSRFREELAAGADREQALRTTMHTAGRTVIFSSLTVAAALASLTVFPLRFLVSMGIGGAVVALVAATVSLTLLPAALYLMAPRIARHKPAPPGAGRWYGFAHGVMRRPGVIALATAAVMLVLAIPALSARWSGVDASVLPSSQSANVAFNEISANFTHVDPSPMTVALTAPASAAPAVIAYAHRLAAVPQIEGVQPARYLGRNTWELIARVRGHSIEPPAQQAVDAARAIPTRLAVAVGGDAAQFHDRQAAIGARLPVSLALLICTTLLILWVMTGSVILPVKALVMNALTVGVATGALVFVFQDGRLTGLLAYTSQGGIESTDFLVLVSVAFALSTDYGVFLLTRVREARQHGLENREAVAVGVQRTGAIVTAAAILLAIAIGAFSTSKVIFIKEIGVGAVVAVLVDAFVVRSLLVPSLMALLGEWNWWQPRRLRRVHARLDALTSEA